jgi:hypothetical protein
MAEQTIRVHGLRETLRAFQKLDREASKELRAELVRAAFPVAEDVRARLARYQGASLNTIRPGATQKGAFVRQNKRKVTGRRADFGALQMTHGFLPALEENADEVNADVERLLDKLIAAEGF